MNKILFGIIAFILIGYLGMGVYCAQETVLNSPSVAEKIEEAKEMNLKDICSMVKEGEIDGRSSYTYDCGGKIEDMAKQIKKEVKNFKVKNFGYLILGVNAKIYNRTWNDPAWEPFIIYGVDFLWPFRETAKEQ